MLQDITSGRIQRACTLLANTTLSVGEIAKQCGYASTSHFIKLFRKLMGCAPMGYRKSDQQQKTPPHGLNHERGVSV